MTANNQSETARLFVALEIEEHIRSSLQAVMRRLEQSHANVRWVPVLNLHLSLFFLGNSSRQMTPEIKKALDSVATLSVPFNMQVRKVDTFGRPKRPKVIWAGVEPVEELMNLQSNVSKSMQELGFQPDKREFKPHITLGRVKSGRNMKLLLEALESVAEREFGMSYSENLVLMQSQLKSTGAEYSPIQRSKYG